MPTPGSAQIRPVMRLQAYCLGVSGIRLFAWSIAGFVILAIGFGIARFILISKSYDFGGLVSSLAASFEGQALIPAESVSSRTERVLRFVQAISANMYLAVIIGLITFRMLRRKENIRLPHRLAYNQHLQAFEFRFVNFDASDLANVEIRAFLRKRISRATDSFVRDMMFPIKLNLDFEPYVDSMMIVAFRSEPPLQEGSGIRTDQLNRINLDTVDADSAIVVTVAGTAVNSGDSIVSRKVYWVHDILIGSYRDTESNLKVESFGVRESWRQRDYSLFDDIEGEQIPALEWRKRHGRDGLASIKIGNKEHAIHYPKDTEGNIDMHVSNILNGSVYRPLYLLDFSPTTVIDIGANVGASAAYFLSKFPDCIVHCFEPEPTNYLLLTRNLGSLKNVNLRPIGLFDSDKEMVLLKGRLQCMQHSVFRSAEVGDDGERIQLKDALAEIEPLIDERTIIKIDTEGCELAILKRLFPVIGKFKVIYFEFHSEEDRLQAEALLNPTHGLWSSSVRYAHRGDQCYVHRSLWENDSEISQWKINSDQVKKQD